MSTVKQALQRIAREVPEARPPVIALLKKMAACNCGDEIVAGGLDEMFAGRKYDPGPGKQKPYGPPYKTKGLDKGKWAPKQKGKCFYETGDEGDRCYTTTNGGPGGQKKPDTGPASNRKEYNKKYRKQRWDMKSADAKQAHNERLAELRADRTAGMISSAVAALEAYAADPSAYNRADLSDYGINVFREEARKRGYDQSDMVTILREEAGRVRGLTAGKSGLVEYLRVRRTGSEYPLTRKAKTGIFCQFVAKGIVRMASHNERLAELQQKQAGRTGEISIGRYGITLYIKTRVAPVGVFASELGKTAARGRREITRLMAGMAKQTGVMWLFYGPETLLGVDGGNIVFNEEVNLTYSRGPKKQESQKQQVRDYLFTVGKQQGWTTLGDKRAKKAGALITPAMFAKMRPGTRVRISVRGNMVSGGLEFQVARTTYSKKYNVYSKRLLPIGDDGNPIKRGIAPWTLYQREGDSGEMDYISLAHSDMGVMMTSFEFVR